MSKHKRHKEVSENESNTNMNEISNMLNNIDVNQLMNMVSKLNTNNISNNQSKKNKIDNEIKQQINKEVKGAKNEDLKDELLKKDSKTLTAEEKQMFKLLNALKPFLDKQKSQMLQGVLDIYIKNKK